ncbi:hypothetical protein GMORB2_4126 [Geosmithia morbida]|uniref:RRN7-type domain-containing protein n=1 Tax=Geosmithia morbida TaxID=1094350 RepID=A0A9P4YY84_9HYPO|nr:uncharacterized protein GMORB2_4126 [Geosmithia morbida]KAF4125286.1 hypothetical protein GMORB2_4126 [Geosmithia morbida]
MEERSEARRLPRGERCSQCGDRKYYLENGMRFCASNGHEIEGFIQFDVTEEEDAGRLGSVARREKEIREKETRQLTGLEGKSLYLEALQLVLRSQTLWLIREKGHAEELETVVRDLWDLRIRAFGSMVVVPDNEEEGVVESIEAARSLAEILRCSFQFPTSKSRIFPVDMPETLVASLMVVATKILFPFQQGTQTTQEHSASIISPLRFDWDKWIQAIQKFQDEHDGGQAAGPKPNFSNMTADSVVNMTTKELDDYLAHMSSFIDKTTTSAAGTTCSRDFQWNY